MLERVWRKRNTCTLLVGMQIVVAIMKIIWRLLKKKKIYIISIPLLGIYLENTKTLIQDDKCTPRASLVSKG